MKSLPITRLTFILTVISLTLTSADAVTIVSWDMTGAAGDEASIAGIPSPLATPADLVRGAGLAANSGVNSFNSRGWTGESGDYLEFGFTVESGYSVALETLLIGTRSSSTGPGTIGVYHSLNGFATPVFTIDQDDDNFAYNAIDLSSLGSVAGTFTIRLIEIGSTQAGGAGTTSSGGTFRVADYFDGAASSDVRITGEFAKASVPDGGATFALLGLGFCSLLGARRKLD